MSLAMCKSVWSSTVPSPSVMASSLVEALHRAGRFWHGHRRGHHFAADCRAGGGAGDLLLDVAERGRELLEGRLILTAQARLQAVGVFEHGVEHALVFGGAAGGGCL